MSFGLSVFIVLSLALPVLLTAKGEFLFAKLAWIALIGLASFLVFMTGRISRWRSFFFMIIAWAFVLEFKASLIGLRGSAWFTPQVQEVPYCHVAIASVLLNYLHSVYLAFVSGDFLKWSPLLAGVLFWLLVTLSIGQGWCSWACFYGGLDTTFSKLRKKPILKWSHLPAGARDFALALFVAVALVSLTKSQPVYCLWICPLKISTGFLDPHTTVRWIQFYIFATAGTVSIILLPIVTNKRTFCTFLCPFGAWQALVGRANPFRVTIDPEICTRCGQCLKVCPIYAIDEKGVNEYQILSYCNRCGDCFPACPSGAIDYTILGRKPSANLARIFFLISAWLIGGSVSLLFVPAAMLRVFHGLTPFFM